MKRIIAIMLSVIMVCFIFVGCSETSSEKPEDKPFRFVEINEEVQYDSSGFEIYRSYIYADKETGVMYLLISGGNRAGVTVLLDTDGKPLIYNFDGDN